jgi:hypothetical protein
MKSRFAILALLLAGLAAAAPAAAQGRWEVLGSRSVGFDVDRDVIQVGRGEGRFSRIRLRATGNGIHILDLKVVYGNGQVQDIPVRANLRAGAETRPLDLSGEARGIREIQIVYQTRANFRGRATVEVLGERAERAEEPRRDWQMLGSKPVGFNVDRDVIPVGRSEGRFTRIGLKVERNDIHVFDMKVVFRNGEVQDIPVRGVLRAGAQTRSFDLSRGERVIREVQIVYQSRPGFAGQAVVEVWGAH